MKRLLMCPPEYYGIEYEINPWMRLEQKSIHGLAVKQWGELYQTLTETLGVQVLLVAPQPGLPDMVFTANAGLPLGGKVILSNFRHRQRQGEARYFKEWFEKNGYEVIMLPSEVAFEGAGDALFLGDNLFAGYLFRSEVRGYAIIGEVLGVRVLSLELVDPRFYHLDTCLCPLSDKTAIYYPGAFDQYAIRVIENFIADPIAVSKEEALRFACNAVVVRDAVVTAKGCPKLGEELMRRGYRHFELDLSEFIKAGGAAKCLTLEI